MKFNRKVASMWSGEYRRSARISELDARKAQQAQCRNEGSRIINSGMAQGQVARQSSNRKLGRKRKTRHVHDLVDNDADREVQKTGNSSDGDHHTNAVDMSSRTAMPERKKLELLLDRLKRRDFHRFFAEPVNGEEVEGYYDVIKNPMDFSTITQKLNCGEYKTLKEFEHDISFVYKNAMQFNASDTIYYKQGHAIKELANKLFQILKNDPKNFEAACSMRRGGPGRRIKAMARSLNSNSCNKTRGCRDKSGSENFEQQTRWTYGPWTSFLNDNGSLMAQVYSSSQKLELGVKENKIGYAKSLMWFANNLGPTTQMVARRKLGSGIAETPTPQTAALNCHFQAQTNPIPSSASTLENIIKVPSSKLPGNFTDCQRLSGREADKYSTLYGGKVPTVNTIDIYDVLRGGIAQASSTMKALGEIHGRMVQASKNEIPAAVSARKSVTVAPSVKIPGHSASKEVNVQHHTSSVYEISMVDTVNKCDFIGRAITYASITNENLDKAQDKMVQTGTFRADKDAAREGISVSGHEKLDFPAEWNADSSLSKFTFVKFMLDAINDSPDHTSEVFFSGPKVQDSVPASYSCSSSSLQWPVQASPGRSSQAIAFMHDENSQNLGGYQIMQEGGGPSSRGSIEQGGLANWLNLKLNIEGGSSGTKAFCPMQGFDLNYLGGLHQVQATVDKAGRSKEGNGLLVGEVPNWLKPRRSGTDAAGAHSTINGSQYSNWFKPTALGPQPVLNDWFQWEGKSLAEAEPQCHAELWRQQGWGITPRDRKMVNMCDNERRATSGQGQFRIGAPTDNRQKQPFQDSSLLHWAFYP